MSGLLPLMGSGIVLTGGTSQLEGIVEMAEFIFDIPVRRGSPMKIGGLTDIVKTASYATSVGLLLYGWNQISKTLPKYSEEDGLSESFHGWTSKIKNTFEKIF
jgi:cell division protein FtsA